jgi:hypothetical protein
MASYRNRPAYADTGLGARFALARAISTVASLVAAVIVLAIVLQLLGANSTNGIVHAIHRAGSWLSAPFHGLFSLNNGNLQMAVNWGLAAIVYRAVGRLIARVIVR